MQNLLRGTSNEARRYHLILREQVSLREINTSLLSKWIWLLGEASNQLWKKIIVAKYGSDEIGRYTVRVLRTHGCSFWKGIVKT